MKPTNPFRIPELRQAFDELVAAYFNRSNPLYLRDGSRNTRNSFGATFWKGFEGKQIGAGFTDRASRELVAYAYYRAGVACKKCADLARNGQSNSVRNPTRGPTMNLKDSDVQMALAFASVEILELQAERRALTQCPGLKKVAKYIAEAEASAAMPLVAHPASSEDARDPEKHGDSRVASQHILIEGYLTLYTDGTHVMCPWEAAP